MRFLGLVCAVSLVLVSPNQCEAQATSKEQAERDKEDRAEQERNEDVEVLRQVIAEAVEALYHWPQERIVQNCASCHSFGHSTDGEKWVGKLSDLEAMHKWVGSEVHKWVGRDGVLTKKIAAAGVADIVSLANYVPEQGIIVQLEAPPPVVKADWKAWVAADSGGPSRWEILLRGLRGEPEKNPPLWPHLLGHEYRRVHRLELTEKIVDVLVENGRNLRHLPPEEQITVAFTFRPTAKETKESKLQGLIRHYAPSGAQEGLTKLALESLYSAASQRTAAETATADLLLRQGQYQEAIAAYEKALKDAGIDPAERKAAVPAMMTPLLQKLVQAQVGAKNFTRATELLQWLERSRTSQDDELTFLRRAYLDITGTLPTPEDAKAYLNESRPNRRELLLERLLAAVDEEEGSSRMPSRMLIRCTKKQLDAVAAGKMTKLEFASQVKLKYFKPAPDAKDKKPHHKK